jgi:hypothetical protein
MQVGEGGVLSCPGCGLVLHDVRSAPEHRGFFAYLTFALKHWPPAGFEDFKPTTAEELRAWVEIRAGHKKPSRIYTFRTPKQAEISADFAKADMAADRLEGIYSWFVPLSDSSFEVQRAASIAWDKLGEARFNKLVNEVSAIIKDIVGISFQEWKEGAHRGRSAA